MHYVYWLHRCKRRGMMRRSLKEEMKILSELSRGVLEMLKPKRKEITSSGFKDYIGVFISLTPEMLSELKKKAGVQDNEQAILKAIRHFLKCQFDVNEED